MPSPVGINRQPTGLHGRRRLHGTYIATVLLLLAHGHLRLVCAAAASGAWHVADARTVPSTVAGMAAATQTAKDSSATADDDTSYSTSYGTPGDLQQLVRCLNDHQPTHTNGTRWSEALGDAAPRLWVMGVWSPPNSLRTSSSNTSGTNHSSSATTSEAVAAAAAAAAAEVAHTGASTGAAAAATAAAAASGAVPLTLTTHLTWDRRWHLKTMCRSWPGPITAALHVAALPYRAGGRLSAAQKAAGALLDAREASLQALRARVSEFHTTVSKFGCQLDLVVVLEVLLDDRSMLLYPVNTLRNIARLMARTPLIAIIDVDFMVSASLYDELRTAAGALPYIDLAAAAVAAARDPPPGLVSTGASRAERVGPKGGVLPARNRTQDGQQGQQQRLLHQRKQGGGQMRPSGGKKRSLVGALTKGSAGGRRRAAMQQLLGYGNSTTSSGDYRGAAQQGITGAAAGAAAVRVGPPLSPRVLHVLPTFQLVGPREEQRQQQQQQSDQLHFSSQHGGSQPFQGVPPGPEGGGGGAVSDKVAARQQLRLAEMVARRGKSYLRGLYDKGQVEAFNPGGKGQANTRYDFWFKSPMPYTVEWGSKYEPFVIVDRLSASWADVRFRGYGKNKMVLLRSMAYDGYEFRVHPLSYLLHRPHGNSGSKGAHMAASLLGKGEKDESRDMYWHNYRLYQQVSVEMAAGNYTPALDPATVACRRLLPWWAESPPLPPLLHGHQGVAREQQQRQQH